MRTKHPYIFGASTAPYAKASDWPEEEWERDIETMQELSFNTVRIFAAWDRIERAEGEFDYAKQDRLIALAEKHHISVILNLGGLFGNPCGCYQPQWLARNPACHPWLTDAATDGVLPNSFDLSKPNRVCPDDPMHLEKAKAFMQRTLMRYAGSEAIVAWMIWNEPDRRRPCFCPCSLSLYRAWLEKKYGSLEALNEKWSSESPIAFERWEDVPAVGVPSNLSVRDWVMFNQHRLVQTMTEFDELVRRHDPRGRPSTANIVYHHAAYELETHGPNLGIDVVGLGQALGMMGVSCYTIAHPFDIRPAYETAYKLSRLRSASRDAQKRFYVLETEVGPFKRMITDAQRKQRFYQLLAHNAKAIVLWNYRSRISDGQVGDFHLQKWDGAISRRGRAAGEFARILQTHSDLLNQVYPEQVAAVLVPEEHQVLSYVTHRKAYIERHESRFGAFKLLWDLQLPVDCLAENNLDRMNAYKVVLLPLIENMNGALADRLCAYVEAGGTLVAEAPFAFKDMDGYLYYHAPGCGLDTLFGGWTADREGWETATPITCPEGEARVHFLWHEFHVLPGGESLATYADGATAVVGKRLGKGRTILAGTEVFRQYVVNPQPAMTALLRQAILESGAAPTARLDGDTDNVEVSRLSGPGGRLYLVNNHNPHPATIRMELPESGPWLHLETGSPVNLTERITLEAETVLPLYQPARA